MRQQSKGVLILIVPPFIFLLKDVVATIAVLSTEPGITARAALYYHVALVPGILWFDATYAILFNLIFGVIVGLCIFLCFTGKPTRLIIIPPLAFFLKDTVVVTLSFIMSQGGTARSEPYYSLALLPGSILQRAIDPILVNLVVGALFGLVLYVRAIRRKDVVSHSN